MKFKKTLSFLLTILLISLTFFNCFAVSTSVKISVNNLSLKLGSSYQLSATTLPSNTSNVSWDSENASIVSVNANGVIYCNNSGTTRIYCKTTDGSNLTDYCTVTVTRLAQGLSLSQGNVSIKTGGNTTIYAYVSPDDTSNKSVSWSSNNTGVATVSNGVVYGVSVGSAMITCCTTDGSNLRSSCIVSVKQGVQSISLNKTSANIKVNAVTQLTANVEPSSAENKSVYWSSSDNSVATVNSSGVVVGKSVGTSVIYCSSSDNSNIQSSCRVNVTNNEEQDAPQVTEKITNKPIRETTKKQAVSELPTKQEPTKLTETEIEEAVGEIFESSENNENNNVTENQSEEKPEKKISITELLSPDIQQDKKSSIVIKWLEIKQIAGYELFVATTKDKKKTFSDEDYSFICDTKESFMNVSHYLYKTYYSVKIRAYTLDENSNKIYSDFTEPIQIKSSSQGLWQYIKSLFSQKQIF